MSKKIEPGMPCIIRGSVHNDGRIVTPLERNPSVLWKDSLTDEDFRSPGWKVAETLVKKGMMSSAPIILDVHLCEESVMYPLDNPGDDEVDMFPLSRTLVKEA